MAEPATTPRLVRVEATLVRIGFRRPLLDATGEYTHRRTWIVRAVDDAGREGFGEAAVSPTATDTTEGALASLVREHVPRLVAGLPLDERELLAEGEPGRALLAGVTGAIRMLADGANGIVADRSVAVSAYIGFGGPEAGADAAAQAVELGFETLEIRAGAERQTGGLVDRVRAIRQAVGPGPRLRIDAGGAWDLETAAERLAAIEPFRLEYVEQPLAAWDVTGHAALRERVRVPIALDESLDSEGSARAALADRAADVLVVKPARVGGDGVTRRIAAAAEAAGADVVVGTFYETGVGIAAALRIAASLPSGAPGAVRVPRAQTLATAGVLGHDLLRAPLAIEEGRMLLPAAIALDEAELDARALERVEASA